MQTPLMHSNQKVSTYKMTLTVRQVQRYVDALDKEGLKILAAQLLLYGDKLHEDYTKHVLEYDKLYYYPYGKGRIITKE